MTRRPPAARSAREGFAAANTRAAAVILADIERYGGEGAGLVQWARLLIEKQRPTVRGPLFRGGRKAGSMRYDAETLGQRVHKAMERSRALAAQRQAAATLAERCQSAPTVCGWARAVMRSDELPTGFCFALWRNEYANQPR